ncbi:hypothetical protein TNCV_343791 [Trichonephila clavipes]|nr:hypothetical protein TNCV_343791 [Trichonephila clavipes]
MSLSESKLEAESLLLGRGIVLETQINGMVVRVTLTAVLLGLGSNPGENMDVCKSIVPLRHGGTLNSRQATSPLVRLVEEKWEAPVPLP